MTTATEKKFVVIGGHTEGGKFVSATQLAAHYSLDLQECILASSEAMARGLPVAGKIVFRPWAKDPFSVVK